MESTCLTGENIATLYRFTLLLSGEAGIADAVFAAMLEESATRLAQLRSGKGSMVFAVKKLREHCLKMESQPAAETEASGVAARFHTLPEPERSSLAMLYLNLFPAREIASFFGITLEELSSVLGRARSLLRNTEPPLPNP